MAFLECLVIIFLSFILIFILITIYTRKNLIPKNWPIVGMIPVVFANSHRLFDYATDVLIQTHGTFLFKGPLFANINLLFTADPLDIHHMLSKNFSNYPKGDKFLKIFDIFGEGIITADGKMWEIQRKVIVSTLKQEGFRSMMETCIWNKVENGLVPVLESFIHGTEFDLQDIFQRFTFDTICQLLFNEDPQSLSLDFPSTRLSKAFTEAEETILFRHLMPPSLMRMQQILSVGIEKKMSDAWKHIDQFIYKWLEQNLNKYNDMNNQEAEKLIFFTALMRELKAEVSSFSDCTKFLRDTIFTLIAAGKDTTSSALCWFFYLLARNPTVEEKLLEEILTHLEVKGDKRWRLEEIEKMVYLHGALCESMRLYPPIPLNNKCPLQPEILPSGHKVDQNINIILCFYSMGRMRSIWGEDCMEFKPERWISSSRRIKHEPSYKIPTFNAGPRTCLGKNMALSQLKIVASMIIYRYRVQLVEGHPVLPADSMILQMKHGLKVKLKKRSEVK